MDKHKYFPGNYDNTCAICKKVFHLADKMCFICEDCCETKGFQLPPAHKEEQLKITQEWVDEYVIMRDSCKSLASALSHMLWMSDKWGREWFNKEDWDKKEDATQSLDNYLQITKVDPENTIQQKEEPKEMYSMEEMKEFTRKSVEYIEAKAKLLKDQGDILDEEGELKPEYRNIHDYLTKAYNEAVTELADLKSQIATLKAAETCSSEETLAFGVWCQDTEVYTSDNHNKKWFRVEHPKRGQYDYIPVDGSEVLAAFRKDHLETKPL